MNFSAPILTAVLRVCCALGLSTEVAHAAATTAAAAAPVAAAVGDGSRVLKFEGVPLALSSSIKRRFPFVFEREVKLSELDPIVRYLMSTGGFSNVEVVDRETQSGAHELVLVANLLRKIKTITVTGNSVLSTSEIVAILNVSPGQPFERKDLLNAADELRQAYQVHGYQNTKVEIEFELPNENEVLIKTVISEGEPLRISELTIDCANPKLKSALTKLSSRDRNAILTEDLLNSLQKRLSEEMKDRHFLLARLSEPTFAYNPAHTQAKVSYSVESPWELSIDFVGNHYFSDGTIENLLASDKLSGATSSPAPDMAEKIRRMYQNAGFANVEVTSSETKEERTFKYRIQFKISESPRVAIDSFQVTGTLSRPQDYYAELLHTLSTGIIDKGFYNKAELEETSKRLITELQNQGYLRAKVQSTRSEYSKDKSKVTIYLALDEGPLTQVRQIRFDGADSFNDEQLKKIMTIKAGAALSLKDLETSIQSLKDFYSSQGFIEMRIANENERNKIVFYNDNQSQATIEFHIVEGPRVTVESIVLQGNGFTKDEVIRRELSFKKGDLLTPEKINDSIFHLQNLGLFSKVAIRTSEKGTMMAARTVIVEVEERDPGIFTLGFGINNERSLTFRGYLGLSYRNLNGTGRGLSFRGDPKYSTDPAISYIEQRIALGYTEPYLFEDHARGRVNVVRDVHFYGFDSATGQTIISNDNSIGLLIERELTRHTKLTFTAYSLTNEEKFLRQTLNTISVQNIGKTGPLLEVDYRDDIFNPTRGTYSTLEFDYSDPYLGSSQDSIQTINFVKTTASTTRYTPLHAPLFNHRELTWANSVRGGYLANISPSANGRVPSDEAFFLGGRNTIRGFDSTDLERIPNLIDLNVANLTDFYVRHESYFYLFKTEFRFPLVSSWNLGGEIFYDGGAVLISGVDLPMPYRDSIGLGFRITTPVGPVILEYGMKLNRRLLKAQSPYDIRESPGAFHFSIGSF